MHRVYSASLFVFIFLVSSLLILSGSQAGIIVAHFNNNITDKEDFMDHKNSLETIFLPTINDWIIDKPTIIENESLLVSENIFILDGGALYINNSEINIYSANDDKLRVEVFSGGELIIFNSNITDILKDNSYYIKANKGSKLLMNGARINYAGFSSGFEHDTSGLWINTDNVTIKNSQFTYNYYGIFIEASKNVSLSNCYISSNYEGLGLNLVHNITISNTTISSNFDNSLVIDSSEKVTLENLTIFENGVVINSNNVTELIFRSSLIYDNHDASYFINAYKVQFINNTIFNNLDGVYFYTSSNITIENNSLSQNKRFAVYLLTSTNVTLHNNTLFSNEHGINLFNTTSLSVRGNLLENDGIWFANYTKEGFATIALDNSNKVNRQSVLIYFNVSDLTITQAVLGELIFAYCNNLTIADSSFSGVELYQSANIHIMSSNASNMDYGIYLRYITNIVIFNNSITNCYIGNYIIKSSNIIIQNNTISFSNKYGVFLGESSNTTAYCNELIDNAVQVLDDSAFFWDNGSIGNYWSDYTGVDADVDGIGDTPYKVDSDSEDRFPIVPPDLIQPSISDVTHEPQIPNELDSVIISAKVTDKGGLAQVILSYHDGETWYNISMKYNTTKMLYEETVPPYENETEILYKIYAVDYAGNWNISPIYSYTVHYHETNPPKIVNITQEPRSPTDLDSVLIKVNITDESDIAYVILSYSVQDVWHNLTMTYYISSKLYQATIPKMSVGTEISYKVYAVDKYNNTSISNTQKYIILSHDIESPTIHHIFHFPQSPTDNDEVTVFANITDESEISVTILSYTNGSAWYNVTMAKNTAKSLYKGVIPKSPAGIIIQYFIYSEDSFGNAITSNVYNYSVITRDTTGPIIEDVFYVPENPTDQDVVTIFANVTDISGVSNVILSYHNGSLWSNISMQYNNTLGLYVSRIPKMPSGLTIMFKIYTNDSVGNWAESKIFSYTISVSNTYTSRLSVMLIVGVCPL